MRRWSSLICLLVLALPLMAACGGDDDDDDDGGGDASSNGSGNKSDGNGSSDDNRTSSNTDFKITAGTYGSGKVHIEVSGDKDFKFDADGNGIAVEDFALLTFTSSDAGIQLAFGSQDDQGPGGFSLTTADIATAGEWGKDCKVSFEQSADEVKGAFTCDKLAAIKPGSANDFKVNVKGTYTVGR